MRHVAITLASVFCLAAPVEVVARGAPAVAEAARLPGAAKPVRARRSFARHDEHRGAARGAVGLGQVRVVARGRHAAAKPRLRTAREAARQVRTFATWAAPSLIGGAVTLLTGNVVVGLTALFVQSPWIALMSAISDTPLDAGKHRKKREDS